MPSSRKSFIVHKDSLSVVDELTDEQAGKLFKAIKAYQSGEEIELDFTTKLAFAPFKSQFIRDDEKYQNVCKARAEAGSKGGKQRVANQANASNCKQELANQADSKSKSDSKSDSDSDSDLIKDSLSGKPDDDKFSEGDLKFANWMFELVLAIAPKTKKPNVKKWADTVRLMRERDGLSHREMAEVFKWANKDSFWSLNILSPSKLRDKYSELHAKMCKQPHSQQQLQQQPRKPRMFGQ